MFCSKLWYIPGFPGFGRGETFLCLGKVSPCSPAPGFDLLQGVGTGGDNRTIKQGKGSCRVFQDETGISPAPEQLLQSLLLSPKNPKITDKPWDGPAWVLEKEKGEKAPECTLGPHPLIPLLQAPGWSIPFLPVPFQGGKSKVTPQGWAWEGSRGGL